MTRNDIWYNNMKWWCHLMNNNWAMRKTSVIPQTASWLRTGFPKNGWWSSLICWIAPVVPARGGAEVALRLSYKTFFIYRTCVRRAPARPVRVLWAKAARCSTCHTWNSTLHTSHFISSHLIWILLTSSQLISSLLVSPHLFSYVS